MSFRGFLSHSVKTSTSSNFDAVGDVDTAQNRPRLADELKIKRKEVEGKSGV